MFKNRPLSGYGTPVSTNIIIINALAWVACRILIGKGVDPDSIFRIFGLHFVAASHFKFYQFITYLFMHALSPAHVFFNMFAVFMFGRVVEQTWGATRFLIFYLITGIGAGVIQQLAWWYMLSSSGISMAEMILYGYQINGLITVGASGAVFGILLAFGMIYPNIPLYIMFIPIPIKAKYAIIGYGVIELFLGVANFRGDNIAHFAHLGGMLFGFILIKLWRRR